MRKLLVFIGVMLWVGCGVSLAQEINPFTNQPFSGAEEVKLNPVRKILNKITVGVSSGYGQSFFRHDLPGSTILSTGDQIYLLPQGTSGGNPVQAYTQWVNDPQLTSFSLNGTEQLFSTDTSVIGYQGASHNIPLNLTLDVRIMKRFRIGLGVGLEYMRLGAMRPVEGELPRYNQSFSSFQTRFFGLAGYQFYQYWDYAFTADIRVGKHNLGGRFNKALVSNGLFFNLGVTIEKNYSKYFRLFLRPSYEFRSYSIALPEANAAIDHRYGGFYIEFGLSLNYPLMPRSPYKSDKVQMEHIVNHPKSGKMMWVRGQPITKKQNPKMGENHPELFKYKGKNKRKRNPY